MPDISDIMDVNIEDLSPEQLQQLKDATVPTEVLAVI
jgi:hypothetical protein